MNEINNIENNPEGVRIENTKQTRRCLLGILCRDEFNKKEKIKIPAAMNDAGMTEENEEDNEGDYILGLA